MHLQRASAMSVVYSLFKRGQILEISCREICRVNAGWHCPFGNQHRKWWLLGLHHSVPHPRKPHSCENGTNQSITGRRILALSAWRAQQEVTFWTSLLCSSSIMTPFLRKLHGAINKSMNTSCLAASDVWRFCVLPFSPYAHKILLQAQQTPNNDTV